MKRLNLRIRRIGYGLFLVCALVAAAIWHKALGSVWRDQGWTLAGAASLMLLSIVIQARNFMSFLGRQAGLALWPLSRLWALTSLTNYLGPFQPGVAIRVAWLAKRGVHWQDSLLATWRQLCTSVWVSLGGCGVGLLTMDLPYGRVLGGAFIGAFLIAPFARNALLALLVRISRPRWLAARRVILCDALRGIDFQGIAGVVAQYVVGTALLWFVYRAFDAPIHPGHALLLACLVYVSSLVALLPGNLGILEAIYVFGGHGAGLSLAQSAALALLLRCSQIVAACALVLAGPPPGGRKITTSTE